MQAEVGTGSHWRAVLRAIAVVVRGAAVLVSPVAVAAIAFVAHSPFEEYFAHASPAFAYPSWGALLFYLPSFAAFGTAARLWVWRSPAWVFLPVLIGYFVVFLGGACQCEVYPGPFWHREALWEMIGQPPVPAIVVGIGSAVAAGTGWAAAQALWLRSSGTRTAPPSIPRA